MKRLIVPFLFALIAFTAFAYAALAHAQIDHCAPAPGTAVSTAPKEVRCFFTEEIDDKQSTLTVTDSGGARVDNNDGKVDLNDPNHQQMFATLKTLQNGVYKVAWHTVTTDDKGVSDGTWYFGVGQVTVPTYVPPTEAATSAATKAPSSSAATSSAASSAGPTTVAAAATSAATPAATSAVPAVAPTLDVGTPTAPATTPPQGAPDETVPVLAGIAEALVIIGVLVFLYRTTR